jgi:FHA domain/TIR domain
MRPADTGAIFSAAPPPPPLSFRSSPALPEQSSDGSNHVVMPAPASPGQKDRGLAGRDLAHEYIQFTAFYSRVVPTTTWNTLLVYAHIEAALPAVREDALKFKEEIGSLASEASAWATLPMTRGTQITLVPTCQGVRFNPERFVFTWIEDWHQVKFRFQVDQRLANTVGNGEITMYAGPLIIGSVKISMRFVQQSLAPPIKERESIVEAPAALYKHIFTSYSHQDTPVVLACRNAYKALGFESLIDIDTLRSGQRWNIELMRMIDSADLFQLFWSPGAARSAYVRQEWQYALQRMPGESFIRPVYWEKPLVPPPAELKHLHFAYIELPRLETPEETQKFSPRAMLPARVRVERGKEPGRIYEIHKEALSIGRSRGSDLFLEDLQVSRLHASVLKTNGGIYVLRDEGSANGTKLNGQTMNQFQMLPLTEGDRIQIGETVLVFLKGNIP